MTETERAIIIADLIRAHRKNDINETVENRVIKRLLALNDRHFEQVTDYVLDNLPNNYELDSSFITKVINELGIDTDYSPKPQPPVNQDHKADPAEVEAFFQKLHEILSSKTYYKDGQVTSRYKGAGE
jgi:hypothetical protein